MGLGLALALAGPAAAQAGSARSGTLVDGNVRFQVITPSLVRMEHAADGRFEDRRTQTTAGRLVRGARFTTSVRGGERIIQTSRMTLRWRRGSAPFGPGSVRVRIGRRGRVVSPQLGANPAPLGGWRRSLDHTNGPVPLHEGVLSRAGWYLLDDSPTALLTGDWFEPRPARDGAYQDLYLFAYGDDYARALADLRALTGAAPLLPRKAFGVWFSRWWPYGEADWREIAERFRQENVPLDTLSVDTDFKAVHDPVGATLAAELVGAPNANYSWNAWDWNYDLYPDPERFFAWAREQGIEVGLNLHPSINSRDPRYPETEERAGGPLEADPDCRLPQADSTGGECRVFDWTNRRHVDAYFNLHDRFERQGTDFWWLDWCCDGSRADAPGLTPDTWINKLYFDRQRARGSRWPAFQRIGGSYQLGFAGRSGNGALAEHKYSIQFTGDTCATWPQLGFASEFTAAAASIGMPYVSHDIGTFFAESPSGQCDKQQSPFRAPKENSLTPEMYTRWVQLGTFQPLDRLHSHHGLRLPWEYPEPARSVAADFLRLREALVPHLYTLARRAHDTGVPMVRPLYMTWPREAAAYEHPTQFTLGDLLVAPVAVPGSPAQVKVWFPPGAWVDWFTGERHRGPAVKELSVPIERMPVFVRAGGIVPTQPPVATTAPGPPASLLLTAHRGRGRISYYDDAGDGLEYERGRFARTAIAQRPGRRSHALTIGPARGRLAGMPRRRTYELKLVGIWRPRSVTVGGRRTSRWTYDAGTKTLTVRAGTLPTRRATRIVVTRR